MLLGADATSAGGRASRDDARRVPRAPATRRAGSRQPLSFTPVKFCNVFGLLAVPSLIASGTGAVGAQAPRPAPTAVIALDPYPSTTRAFTVRASIRGHAGVFLWDTGEGVSMITPSFAARVGCTPWGQITGYRMTGDRLDAPHCDDLAFEVQGGGVATGARSGPGDGASAPRTVRLPAPSVIVYDISAFTKPGAPPLDGALGLDVFAGRAITFQLTRGTLTIESPASLAARVAPATGAVSVPVRLVRDAEGLALAVNLGVPTAAGTAWMELDSGNSGPTLFIAKYLAAQFRLDTAQYAPQPVRFTVGDRVPVQGTARMLDHMAIDGNLGVTFLRDWDVTLDLATGRAWVAPASRS